MLNQPLQRLNRLILTAAVLFLLSASAQAETFNNWGDNVGLGNDIVMPEVKSYDEFFDYDLNGGVAAIDMPEIPSGLEYDHLGIGLNKNDYNLALDFDINDFKLDTDYAISPVQEPKGLRGRVGGFLADIGREVFGIVGAKERPGNNRNAYDALFTKANLLLVDTAVEVLEANKLFSDANEIDRKTNETIDLAQWTPDEEVKKAYADRALAYQKYEKAIKKYRHAQEQYSKIAEEFTAAEGFSESVHEFRDKNGEVQLVLTGQDFIKKVEDLKLQSCYKGSEILTKLLGSQGVEATSLIHINTEDPEQCDKQSKEVATRMFGAADSLEAKTPLPSINIIWKDGTVLRGQDNIKYLREMGKVIQGTHEMLKDLQH